MSTKTQYKDSGTDWLGEIPTSWSVSKIKELFLQKKEHSMDEEELLSVYRDHGVIPKSSRDDNHNKESEDLSNYTLIKPDDLVINKMKAWQGSVAISHYRGIVSPAYFTYGITRVGKEKLYLPYLHHLLRSRKYIETYRRISKGVRPAQWDLDPYQFKILPVLIPPLETQKRIADFLDTKTKTIDELIAKKEQLIELLKEKRAAIITQAVTKGLDPKTKLKTSGIGWVNEVPASWTELPLKFLFDYSQGGVWGDEPVNNEDDIICVRVADFDVLTLTAYSDDFTYRNLPGIKPKFLLNERSLLLEKSGGGEQQPVGRLVQYLGSEKATCSNFVQKMQLKSGHNTRFIALLFCALYFTGETKKAIKQTTGIQNLDMGYFLRTSVFLPTSKEQDLIVEYVDKESILIIETISKIQSQIRKLKEYRSSLIYSAVTGKIII